MTDANRPSHWQVIETRTLAVVADNLTHDQAMTRCEALEPHPEYTGFKYNVQPVRPAHVS